jgi:hypothetical protein
MIHIGATSAECADAPCRRIIMDDGMEEHMMTTPREPGEVAEAKADAISLAEALHTILGETDEAETVRVAVSALQGTKTGRDYLEANPIGR